MSRLTFTSIAATVFGVVALGHATRLALTLPVQVGATPVPLWVSWVGLFVSGALCVWGFRSKP